MVDLIKKALYTGLGLAVLTKEKADELIKDFAEQARLSEHEGKDLVESVMRQSEQARTDFQSRIDSAVQAVVQRLNLVSKDEIADLRARLDELATQLAKEREARGGA